MPHRFIFFTGTVLLLAHANADLAQEPQKQNFDGRPWNISSGNASVAYIRLSPIGAAPAKDSYEPPPDDISLRRMKSEGLVAYEDYVAWGAVERTRGSFDWTQHDRMEKAMHAAGLKCVTYTWVHFPPTWLRDGAKPERTLMRCTSHDQETNYLSVFDPRTIEWYDHFYKALRDHFGDRIDDVYACILGPYGEGNYPLEVTAWINMGHCHEGWWCGDEYAVRAFVAAMNAQYGDIATLNSAWGTSFKSFADVRPPKKLNDSRFRPSLKTFDTPQARRRWLDFITWYHQAIVDFSERSLQTVLKYFPKEKIRLKPGGTSAGINPLTYGTYSPLYAKMASKYPGVVLQPGDCQGAVFADKWLGTAYQFYGVKLGTEPASSLDRGAFLQRVFSDASCGASQIFTYEFESHVKELQEFAHLYTGKSGDTEVALFCPTTLHRLGDNLQRTIEAAYHLRDLCEFDVLDELLVRDGALTTSRYKVLVLAQGEVIDQPVLDKLEAFAKSGGTIVAGVDTIIGNVEGQDWAALKTVTRVAPMSRDLSWVKRILPHFAGLRGVDGKSDGLWTCRRGKQLFAFNYTKNPVKQTVGGVETEVAPRSLWVKPD
jgi:hypothetical protein